MMAIAVEFFIEILSAALPGDDYEAPRPQFLIQLLNDFVGLAAANAERFYHFLCVNVHRFYVNHSFLSRFVTVRIYCTGTYCTCQVVLKYFF